LSESTNPTDDSLDSSKSLEEASPPLKEIQPEDRLDAAKRVVDRAYLEFGRELYLEFSSDRFRDRGYKSFDDYARSKGIDPGRARRLRRVFKIFQRDLGVPYERIAAIGYESVTAVIPVITRANKEDWLKKAAELPYDQLIKLVNMRKPSRKKRQVIVSTPGSQPQSYQPEGSAKMAASLAPPQVRPSADGKTDATDDDIVYEKTLYLVGDQNTVFETALENVERRTGSDKVGYLLTCALMEFLAIEAVKDTKDDGRMKYFMSILEGRYGGQLMWVKDKKVARKLSELIEQAESSTAGQSGAGEQPVDGGGGVHPLPIQPDAQATVDRTG